MENFSNFIIPLVLTAVLLRILALPIRLGWKLLVNAACGFVCLWLLNWTAGITGVYFPINMVTVAVSGFLGLPGITLLALVQMFL